MSPANIEGALRVACPMLGGAAAIGNDRPYNVALFALDPDGLAAFAERHGLTAQAHEELARDPVVLAAVEEAVQAANAKVSRVEQIKRHSVLPNIWEPSGDELTPRYETQALADRCQVRGHHRGAVFGSLSRRRGYRSVERVHDRLRVRPAVACVHPNIKS